MERKNNKPDGGSEKNTVEGELKKYGYMISWRDKKIACLESIIKGYEQTVRLCNAIIWAAVNQKQDKGLIINKDELKGALNYNYTVIDMGEYYKIEREEFNGEREETGKDQKDA